MLDKLFVVATAVAFGCSHPSQQHPVDGSIAIDGAGDAGLDASSGSVGITVLDFSLVPAPGMTVVFQNADGTVVAMTTTDAQGHASAAMLAGGSVTAERPQRAGISGRWFYSFTGVKPDDELLVGAAPPPSPTTFQTTFALPSFPNTYEYTITTACGDGGVLGSNAAPVVTLALSCSPVNVYVAAKDMMISNGTIAAMYAPGVAVTPNGTVDLTGASFQPVSPVALDVTNVPNDVTQAFVGLSVTDGQTSFDTIEGGTGTVIDGEATGTASVAVLPGLQFWVGTELVDSSAFASEEIVQRVAAANTYTVDAATADTAWLLDGASYNVAAEQIEWTETAGGTAPDYARAEVIVTPSETRPQGFMREIAGPDHGGSLALPVLPSPLDDFNVGSGDNAELNKFYIANVPGGWDTVRTAVFDWEVFTPPVALGQTAVASAPSNGIVVN